MKKATPKKRATKRPNPETAQDKFERLHWGIRGKAKLATSEAPNPASGPMVLLGDLVAVVYRTTKAGDGLSEYEHAFSAKHPPKLLVTKDGGLVIAGGKYKVTTRGIEG